jgi:hypothetical protein
MANPLDAIGQKLLEQSSAGSEAQAA